MKKEPGEQEDSPRCPGCSYPLAVGCGVCPECGHALTWRPVKPTRVRPPLFVLVLLLTIATTIVFCELIIDMQYNRLDSNNQLLHSGITMSWSQIKAQHKGTHSFTIDDFLAACGQNTEQILSIFIGWFFFLAHVLSLGGTLSKNNKPHTIDRLLYVACTVLAIYIFIGFIKHILWMFK